MFFALLFISSFKPFLGSGKKSNYFSWGGVNLGEVMKQGSCQSAWNASNFALGQQGRMYTAILLVCSWPQIPTQNLYSYLRMSILLVCSWPQIPIQNLYSYLHVHFELNLYSHRFLTFAAATCDVHAASYSCLAWIQIYIITNIC